MHGTYVRGTKLWFSTTARWITDTFQYEGFRYAFLEQFWLPSVKHGSPMVVNVLQKLAVTLTFVLSIFE